MTRSTRERLKTAVALIEGLIIFGLLWLGMWVASTGGK